MNESYSLRKIARRVAILFSPQKQETEVKLFVNYDMPRPGQSFHGIPAPVDPNTREILVRVEFPDGSKISSGYLVVNGKRQPWMDINNSTSYSDDEAVKLLETAQDKWYGGNAGHGNSIKSNLDDLLKEAGIT